MKLILGFLLIIASIVIGVYITKSYHERHKLAHIVQRILEVGFLIVLFNIVSLFTETETICLFAYSVYFIATDWLLYYLLQFSLEYIGNSFEKHVNKKWMILEAVIRP